MKKIIAGVCIVASVIGLNACKNSSSETKRLEDLEREALIHPRAQADSLMRLAKNIRNDEVTRMLELALKARDYGAAEEFDSSSMALLKVADFCRNRQPSKRLYNLLSYTENTFASNILYSSSSAEVDKPDSLLMRLSTLLNGFASKDVSEMAVIAYKKAIDYAQKAESPSRIPLIYYNLSQVYSGKGEPSSAAYYCRKALFAADSIGWSRDQSAFIYLTLGESYANLGDYESARKALGKGATVYDMLPPEDRATLYQNYGKIYSREGHRSEALVYFRKALDEIKRGNVGIDYSYYSILMQYVECAIPSGQNLPLLRRDINESIRFFGKLGDKDNELYAKVLLLKLALEEHKNDEVRRIIKEAVAEGIETNATTAETKLAWYKAMDAFYRLSGHLDKAYPYYHKSVELDDSIRGFTQKQYVANLGMSYRQDTTLLNHKITDQQQKSEIRELSWKYMTVMLAGAIVALGFAGYFIYSRRRRAMQQQQYLSNMNRLKMQNIRNCISPHFTFNMLNREILLSPENGEVYNRLMDLAHLLRRSLDATSQIAIPLSQELDFTQTYVKTLKECGKDFAFHLHVADSIDKDNTLIPSMIIQIPVENAVKHGFSGENKVDDREIDVTVGDTGTGISIEIVNNGMTYSPFDGDGKIEKGIGMQVIYQSLLMMNMKNKEKITFTISDRHREHAPGTRVSIYIPYHFDYSV